MKISLKPFFAVLTGWLALSLACNFPGVGQDSQNLPQGISQEELRQTLAAVEPFSTPADPSSISTPVPGVSTATPGAPLSPVLAGANGFEYLTQPGDTLPAVAGRFGVLPEQIISAQPLPAEAFLVPGQTLNIPAVLGETADSVALLPDSEVVYSPSTAGFDLQGYIDQAGGYLSTYTEIVNGRTLTGAEIIRRVALESSTNPRLLLALLEYRSHWVLGQPAAPGDLSHPLGFYAPGYRGLYHELVFTATQLNIGYYGWRQGTLTELRFRDDRSARISPALNAGSAAVQHLFAKLYKQIQWAEALYGPENLLEVHYGMFGDPWARAAAVGPLFPADLAQPALELPFSPGERWSYTGGPHASWNAGTPLGAVDFSPVTGEPACSVSSAWVTASAAGVITRSEGNVVSLDLDGDGSEGTGWVLVYLHVADRDHIAPGTIVQMNDLLGHPSCERGKTTGTHVHLARKYNGEWLAADGPLPFVLSGWEVEMGSRIYEGYLHKDGQTVSANPGGSHTSIIVR